MRKRSTAQHPEPRPFTMIEITLALGVIAIGVVAILGMFPIGANASRDAIAETYAAETAEQMMDFVESTFRADWAVAQGTIPTTKPDTSDVAGTRVDHTGGTIYSTPTLGKFRVIRFVNVDDSTDAGDSQPTYTDGDLLDFESIVVVWRNQVTLPTSTGTEAIPRTYAEAIVVEVSWPAQLPYTVRQKSLFVKELFKR